MLVFSSLVLLTPSLYQKLQDTHTVQSALCAAISLLSATLPDTWSNTWAVYTRQSAHHGKSIDVNYGPLSDQTEANWCCWWQWTVALGDNERMIWQQWDQQEAQWWLSGLGRSRVLPRTWVDIVACRCKLNMTDDLPAYHVDVDADVASNHQRCWEHRQA